MERDDLIATLYDARTEPPETQQLIDALPRARAAESIVEHLFALELPHPPLIADIGCRDSRFAGPLATRMRGSAVGVDIVRENFVRTQPPRRVMFVQGRAEQLPLRDGCADVVFCRDTIEHIEPVALLAEARRVVARDGVLLLHATFATELFAVDERAWLTRVLGLVDESLSEPIVLDALQTTRWEIVTRDDVTSEWSEAVLDHNPEQIVANLRTVSRLRRARETMEPRLGPWYDRILAFESWRPWVLLGYLRGVVFVARPHE
jgi:SAM-dependent methyltransferase